MQMGTLRLMFGSMGIGVGLYFAINAFFSTDFLTPNFLSSLGTAIIAGGVGAALIIKYVKDKKKSQNP